MVFSETRSNYVLLSCDSVFIVSTRALSFKGSGKAKFQRVGRDSFEDSVTHLPGRVMTSG